MVDCYRKVTEALREQAGKLWHTSSIWMNPTIHEYIEKLVATLQDPLKVVYLVNSGSEANELALLMARLYTGAYDVISHRYVLPEIINTYYDIGLPSY